MQRKKLSELPPGLLHDYNLKAATSIKYPVIFIFSFFFTIVDNWAIYVFGVNWTLLAYCHIASSNCFGLVSAFMYGGIGNICRQETQREMKSDEHVKPNSEPEVLDGESQSTNDTIFSNSLEDSNLHRDSSTVIEMIRAVNL